MPAFKLVILGYVTIVSDQFPSYLIHMI